MTPSPKISPISDSAVDVMAKHDRECTLRMPVRRPDEWMCNRCWAWNDGTDNGICKQCEAPRGTPE